MNELNVRRKQDGKVSAMKHSLSAWQSYRTWSHLTWFLVLVGLPAVLVIGFVQRPLLESEVPMMAAGIPWAIALFVARCKARDFSCPQCGRLFFRETWYCNDFAKRCVHCGLRKWSEP